MGFIRRIARIGRRIIGGVKNVVKSVTKGIGKVVGGLTSIVGKVLDKLPFGGVIKGFIGKFLNSPLALLAGGALGGFGALLGFAGSSQDLAQVAQGSAGCQAWADPRGRANAYQLLAYQHARLAFAHQFAHARHHLRHHHHHHHHHAHHIYG